VPRVAGGTLLEERMTDMDGDLPPPLTRGATAQHPLLGLTVLLVEDSRHASEAIRLMCLRSGARLRRADSLGAARRHLRVYRPGAAVVDIGLPDGSGLTFLRELAATQPRIDAIVATSGDPDAAQAAIKAGADVFLPKPILNLAAFQTAVLGRAARSLAQGGPVLVRPDRAADDQSLRDDLVHAARLIAGPGAAGKASYLAQFLGGIARASGDGGLGGLADRLGRAIDHGTGVEEALAALANHIDARLGMPLRL
jgi:DNA-binding NarL/FixJ family response regulator